MSDEFTHYTIHNYDVSESSRSSKVVLSAEDVAKISEEGYLNGKWCLENSAVEKLKEATSELVRQKQELDGDNTYSSKRFAGIYVRDIHLKSPEFLNLLSSELPFVPAVRQLMGPRISLRSFSLRFTAANSGDGTMWHSDQRSFVTPRPPFFTEPHVFTLTFYLDGANSKNGPLFVLPGTHLGPHSLDNTYDDVLGQHVLEVESGGVTLFHSALAHRGGENTSGLDRTLLIAHFCPVFCKSANFEPTDTNAEVAELIDARKAAGDEAFLELIGRPGIRYPLFM